ncbi:MAG: aroma-sacti cluster domain-containing protein [Blastocatellia bacterium]
MSNHDRLDAAGMINPDYEFSDEEKSVLEGLSEDEVDALISVQEKVNAAKSDGQDVAFGILH